MQPSSSSSLPRTDADTRTDGNAAASASMRQEDGDTSMSAEDEDGGDDDDDANAENEDDVDVGDAMSETSSLEIDDRESLVRHQEGDASLMRSPDRHVYSGAYGDVDLDEDTMELLAQEEEDGGPQPQQQQQQQQQQGIDHGDAITAAASSPRAHVASNAVAGQSAMRLHASFAPAMSKSVLRTTPAPEIFGEANAPQQQPPQQQQQQQLHGASVPWGKEGTHVEGEGVHLVAVQNEVVATQLRILSSAPCLVLTSPDTHWLLAEGHTPRCRVQVQSAYLPQAIHLEVFLVGYVCDERGEQVMEMLESREVADQVMLEQAVYIRVRVSDKATPGNYEVPVYVFTQHAGFCDEVLSWRTTVHLRVAPVSLPKPQDWAFHMDLWQHVTSIARAHRVKLWGDAHFALIDRYFAILAQLGQKCLTVVATETPWAGQQCYGERQYPSALYEHAVLHVYEQAVATENDGHVHGETELMVDFQHFDRLLALAEKHHMAAEIEIFGILSIWRDPAHGFGSPVDEATASSIRAATASTAPSFSNPVPGSPLPPPLSVPQANADDQQEATTRHESMSNAPLDSWRIRCFHRPTQRFRFLTKLSEVERVIQLLYEHCIARGIVDRVRVCADEPSDVALFYAQMGFLERAAPRFQVKVALNHLDFLNYAPRQVVDVVPLFPLVCADLEVTRRWKAQIHAKKGKFCWYVCCGPSYPNQFVSSPLVEGVLVGFLTFFLELDGFLRWNFCLWPSKPWESLRWRSPSWRVGDMYFVLPGLDGFPVETLRLDALRDAVQAFELLRLAQRALPSHEFAVLKSDIAALIWRTSDLAALGRYLERGTAAEDLYSLDPMDYQRARTLIIDALALAAARNAQADAVAVGRASSPSTSPSPSSSPSPATPQPAEIGGPDRAPEALSTTPGSLEMTLDLSGEGGEGGRGGGGAASSSNLLPAVNVAVNGSALVANVDAVSTTPSGRSRSHDDLRSDGADTSPRKRSFHGPGRRYTPTTSENV